MKLDLKNTLFGSDASSLKVIKVISDTKTYVDTGAVQTTYTYPHGYASDDIMVVGQVYNSTSQTGETFIWQLPYISALGESLVTAEWDDTNVYVKVGNGGSGGVGGYTITNTYTLLVMVP